MMLRLGDLGPDDRRGVMKVRRGAAPLLSAAPRPGHCPRADNDMRTPNRPPSPASQLWREGGYSDDLLLAALAARDGLPVATHRAALLPQLLQAAPGWAAYWNYLRRQIWVLDTYGDDHCRRRAGGGAWGCGRRTARRWDGAGEGWGGACRGVPSLVVRSRLPTKTATW
jgi:hypothetical protein